MNANCNILLTNTGVKGRTLNAKNGNYHNRQHCRCKQQQQLANSNQTTTKKLSHCDTYATRHTRNYRWTSSKLSCLAEPVTPSTMTKEQAQATTTKNTISLVLQK
jgi:hypothetical protein